MVHGEEEQSLAFAEHLGRETTARVHVPVLHECFGLGGRHARGRDASWRSTLRIRPRRRPTRRATRPRAQATAHDAEGSDGEAGPPGLARPPALAASDPSRAREWATLRRRRSSARGQSARASAAAQRCSQRCGRAGAAVGLAEAAHQTTEKPGAVAKRAASEDQRRSPAPPRPMPRLQPLGQQREQAVRLALLDERRPRPRAPPGRPPPAGPVSRTEASDGEPPGLVRRCASAGARRGRAAPSPRAEGPGSAAPACRAARAAEREDSEDDARRPLHLRLARRLLAPAQDLLQEEQGRGAARAGRRTSSSGIPPRQRARDDLDPLRGLDSAQTDRLRRGTPRGRAPPRRPGPAGGGGRGDAGRARRRARGSARTPAGTPCPQAWWRTTGRSRAGADSQPSAAAGRPSPPRGPRCRRCGSPPPDPRRGAGR